MAAPVSFSRWLALAAPIFCPFPAISATNIVAHVSPCHNRFQPGQQDGYWTFFHRCPGLGRACGAHGL